MTAGQHPAILCFDIGGSWIKSANARAGGEIEILSRHPTPLDDFTAFAETLRAIVATQSGKPGCVAISMTGVVDAETGIITCANIPCIDKRPLQADLEDRLGLPVLIANDADCFVLAEAGRGAGRGHDVVLGIILGSGVGGGLVVGGRLINAAGGFAGEWGHGPSTASFAGNPPVAIPSYACTCGQTGCINTIGGARGLERLHLHLHGEALSSTAIVERWEAGDAAAARTIDVYVDLIASPLALAVNITGASIIPAGGGLANSGRLLEKIDRAVTGRTLRRFDRPLVVKAGCEVEPGLIGAAMMGLGHAVHG